MRSNRDQAVDKMSELLEMTSAEKILDYLVRDHLSGFDAIYAMKSVEQEFFPDEDDQDWDVILSDGLEDEDDQVQYEVGMEVEVIDGKDCLNEIGDTGFITELSEGGLLRVTVEGRLNAGNWMDPSQVARINY